MFTTLLAMAVEPAFAYILIPALILSAWSKIRLKLAYRKYDKKITSTGMSGAEIARKILDENNLYYVRIGVVKGEMTDYYDPLNMMLCLSEATYYTCSVAAAGIAAHEAGHAIQHVRKYFPMVLRKAAVACNITFTFHIEPGNHLSDFLHNRIELFFGEAGNILRAGVLE